MSQPPLPIHATSRALTSSRAQVIGVTAPFAWLNYDASVNSRQALT